MAIKLYNRQHSKRPSIGRLKKALDMVIRKNRIDSSRSEISVVLIDDKRIRTLNKRYLGKDRVTDVISFTYSRCGNRITGDVFISVERAYVQAASFGHKAHEEMALLVVHGLLHLMGYDHMKKSQALRMRSEERRLLDSIYGREQG